MAQGYKVITVLEYYCIMVLGCYGNKVPGNKGIRS